MPVHIIEGDSRLTDARAPSTHASTHLSGGSDAIGGLPIYSTTLTVNQTIAAGQQCVVFGPLLITTGVLTITGGQLIVNNVLSGIT